MQTFLEYLDRKQRETVKQLDLVKMVIERSGLNVQDFTENHEDPYIFIENPHQSRTNGGVRIYKIGDALAFRVQKRGNTHPYGKAYRIDLEDMFEDFISDMDEEKAGKEVIKTVAKELQDFFKDSLQAEKDTQSSDIEDNSDPLGRVVVKSTGTDYANTVYNKGTNYGG